MTSEDFETYEQQVAALERRIDRACDFAAYLFKNHRAKIKTLAFERFAAGFEEYGNAAFKKTVLELWDEALQEAADQVVYHAISMELDEPATLQTGREEDSCPV